MHSDCVAPLRKDPLLVALGQELRDLRGDMTQKQLHSLSGVSPNYIGGIERGERKPAVVAIAQLAAALDVALSELVRRAEVEMERRKAGAKWPAGRSDNAKP